MEDKEYWFQMGFHSRGITRKERIKFHLWRAVEFWLFRTSFHFFKGYRVWLLRIFGAEIGKDCYFAPSTHIDLPWAIKIGNKVTLDENCSLYGIINIGDNVNIGNHTCMYGGLHNIKSQSFETIFRPITIEDGAFVGARCTIMGGVKIGTMAVISTGTVVERSVPANKIFMEIREYGKYPRLADETFEKYRYDYNSNN